MPITDLIPWKREERKMDVRPGEDDPFLVMRNEMNNLFDSFFSNMPGFVPLENTGVETHEFVPRLDIRENDKEINVSIELPGLDEKDIQVSLTRDVLSVSGEKKAEFDEKKGNFHRVERSYGSFQRTIQLPCEIDEKKVDAVFKNGVLDIKLAKSCVVQEKTRKIAVKAG